MKRTRPSIKKVIVVEQLDVGQGDCALIILQENHGQNHDQNQELGEREAILIDGGEEMNLEEIVNRLENHIVGKVSKIIVSHYDKDHLGSIVTILEILHDQNKPKGKTEEKVKKYFKDSIIYDPGEVKNYLLGTLGKEFIRLAGQRRFSQKISKAEASKPFLLGKDLFDTSANGDPQFWRRDKDFALLCISQNGYILDENNAHYKGSWGINRNTISLAFIMFYKENVFYTAGDLPSNMEDRLAQGLFPTLQLFPKQVPKPQKPGSIPIRTILKASHHGSKNSTPPSLLNALKPDIVVFSHKRRYGHPHQETIDRICSMQQPCLLLSTNPPSSKRKLGQNVEFITAGVRESTNTNGAAQESKPGHITFEFSDDGQITPKYYKNVHAKFLTLEIASTKVFPNPSFLPDILLEENKILKLLWLDKFRKNRAMMENRLLDDLKKNKLANGEEIDGWTILSQETGSKKNLVLTCKVPKESQDLSFQEIETFIKKRKDPLLKYLVDGIKNFLKDDGVTYTLKLVPSSYDAKNSISIRFDLRLSMKYRECFKLENLSFIYKKKFTPGGTAKYKNEEHKRYICTEFCELQGTVKICNTSLAFFAVVSDSLLIQLSVIAEGLTFQDICTLFKIEKEFEVFTKYFSQKKIEKIELKGLFITFKRSKKENSLFEHITGLGVRILVVMPNDQESFWKDCKFEVNTNWDLPLTQMCFSLTLCPPSKVYLFKLLDKENIPIDSFKEKSKENWSEPALTMLKISFNTKLEWTLSFQIEDAFTLWIFGKKLHCHYLSGEIIKTIKTNEINGEIIKTNEIKSHLQIVFQLDATHHLILTADYQKRNWSFSVDYIPLKDLKSLVDTDLINNLNELNSNHFSFNSLSLQFQRIDGKYSFSGDCLSTYSFRVPSIDIEIQGQGSLSFNKVQDKPCSYTIAAQEVSINRVSNNNGASTSTDIEKWINDLQKNILKIKKMKICKEEDSSWKGEIDIQLKDFQIESSISKLSTDDYLFHGRVEKTKKNVLLNAFPELWELSKPKEFMQMEISFIRNVFLALEGRLTLDFTLFDLETPISSQGKIILREASCFFVNVQNPDKFKKNQRFLNPQLARREIKKKWFLELKGKVEILNQDCEITVELQQGGFFLCKGKITPNNLSLFGWLNRFENIPFAEELKSAKIEEGSVEIFRGTDCYVKFGCKTNYGDITVMFYGNKGFKFDLSFTLQELLKKISLPSLLLDDILFSYASIENKSLNISQGKELGCTLSFENCIFVKNLITMLKGMYPNFPNKIQLKWNFDEKTLNFPLEYSLFKSKLFELSLDSLAFSSEKVGLNAVVSFPELKFDFNGSFDFNYNKSQLEANLRVKLNIKLFKKFTITEVGVNGTIWPLSSLGFKMKARIDGYKEDFELYVEPSQYQIPFFKLSFPQDFCISPKSLLELFFEIPQLSQIGPEFDIIKLKPVEKDSRIIFKFKGLTDIDIECALSLYDAWEAKLKFKIGIPKGIEIYFYMDPIVLLKDYIELTSSKDNSKGPEVHLRLMPFEKKDPFLFKLDGRILFFGEKANANIYLGKEGLKIDTHVKLSKYGFETENYLSLVGKAGEEISFLNSFCFKLNSSWSVEFKLSIRRGKFLINGTLQFDKEIKPFSHEIDLCQISELLEKIVLYLIKDVVNVVEQLKEDVREVARGVIVQTVGQVGVCDLALTFTRLGLI